MDEFTILENKIRRPKPETVALTKDEKDQRRRKTFVEGDLVTVIYPEEEGEYAGTWHARIISFKPKGPNQQEDGYFVEWLEKTPQVKLIHYRDFGISGRSFVVQMENLF